MKPKPEADPSATPAHVMDAEQVPSVVAVSGNRIVDGNQRVYTIQSILDTMPHDKSTTRQ